MPFAASLALLLALPGAALPKPSAPAIDVVSVHLAGDSTLAPKLDNKRPESGWGEYLEAQFRPGTIHVDNRARNGRSTRTFIESGEWQALLDAVRPGDYVLIQFGHNDQSESKPDRYTPLADFGRNLAGFVADVRARSATPILMTPVARRYFYADGQPLDSHGAYADAVRALAASQQVTLVDMQRRTEALLRAAGPEPSKALFLWLAPGEHANYPEGVQDNTHFSPEGARQVADAFAQALREQALPLADSLH